MSEPITPVDGSRGRASRALRRFFAEELLVPLGGFAVLTLLSLTLVVVIMLRPWAGPDKSWRTHMNLTEESFTDYTRSVQTFVSPEGAAPIGVWRRTECGAQVAVSSVTEAAGTTQDLYSCDDERITEWVAHGCASCHGLLGAGSSVGPNLLATTVEDIRDIVRFGPSGMPAFGPMDLTDEHVTLLVEYLLEKRIANPESVPTPTPTPMPTATPVTVTTVGPTPTPSADSQDSDSLALGRLVYEDTTGDVGCAYCHGLDGMGEGTGAGQSAPDIRGASRSDVRQALRGATDMDDIKLSSDELMAVIAYLLHLAR